MLTESEKEWLKTRDKKRPYCFYCEALFGADSCYWKCVTESCAMYPDMKDAAEYEARVAAKLATYATMMVGSDIAAPCLECPCQKAGVCYHGTNKSCQWSFLTTARLQVEEEMDADR